MMKAQVKVPGIHSWSSWRGRVQPRIHTRGNQPSNPQKSIEEWKPHRQLRTRPQRHHGAAPTRSGGTLLCSVALSLPGWRGSPVPPTGNSVQMLLPGRHWPSHVGQSLAKFRPLPQPPLSTWSSHQAVLGTDLSGVGSTPGKEPPALSSHPLHTGVCNFHPEGL